MAVKSTLMDTEIEINTQTLDADVRNLIPDDGIEWQQARDRALLYLKGLGVNPLKSLEITHEALKRAALDFASGAEPPHHPIPAVMQALRDILSKRNMEMCTLFENGLRSDRKFETHLLDSTESDRSEGRDRFAIRRMPNNARLPVMPAMARGKMLPEKMERALLKNLLALISNRKL